MVVYGQWTSFEARLFSDKFWVKLFILAKAFKFQGLLTFLWQKLRVLLSWNQNFETLCSSLVSEPNSEMKYRLGKTQNLSQNWNSDIPSFRIGLVIRISTMSCTFVLKMGPLISKLSSWNQIVNTYSKILSSELGIYLGRKSGIEF